MSLLAALLTPILGVVSVHANDGGLDTTFGTAGIVTTDFGNNDQAYGAVIDSLGRFVTVGIGDSDFGGHSKIALARYNTDGSLDTTFGNNGKILTVVAENGYNDARSVAIDTSNRILITGSIQNFHGGYDYGVLRYNQDGTFDPSFGTGGIVTTQVGSYDFGGLPQTLILDGQGHIIVGGAAKASDNTRDEFTIVRYNNNGSLDTAFGDNGIVMTGVGSYDSSIASIKLDAQNRLLVGGITQLYTDGIFSGTDFAVARYNPDGSLDNSFGNAGIVETNINDYDGILSIAIDFEQRLVVAGYTQPSSSETNFAVARYNSDGSLDNSFGSGGIATASFGANTSSSASSLGIDSQARIVVAGSTYIPNSRWNFAVARYNPNGSLDNSFGSGGKISTSVGTTNTYLNNAYIYSTLIDSSDRIVLIGYSSNGTNDDFTLVRYGNNNFDSTPPVISALTWSSNPLQKGQNTTLTSSVADNASGVSRVEYFIGPDPGQGNGIAMTNQGNGQWSATFGSNLGADTYTIGVRAMDGAGNWSPVTSDLLAVYDTAGGYVTGHATINQLSAGDVLPISDPQNNTKLKLAFTNVKYGTNTTTPNGSFGLQYIVKNNKNEFTLDSNSFDWLVVPDTTHATMQGIATVTTIVNGVKTVSTNPFQVSIVLGSPDHYTVKVYASGANPISASPIYIIDDNANQSNTQIK